MMYPKLEVWQGKTVVIEIQIKKSTADDAAAVDITGATARFMLKECIDDEDALALITKTQADGIAIYDAANGLARCTIDGVDTEALDVCVVKEFPFQIKFKTFAGATISSAVSVMKVRQSVIHAMP
jgi:hypothetical protein